MFPTLARLSKASRRPLTTKRGNKDFYKGTGQAYLPGSHRTGAPGKHVVKGSSKYRLVDEQVRYFVAPPLPVLNSTPLRPYVERSTKLLTSERNKVYGKLPQGGLSGEHYFKIAPREKKAVEGLVAAN
ncbi:hypothetical protein JAAARDRAFT_39403 [Jaapia argillacea MUCL 33604]|uniref:Uncharacterized protein n=1 Tax=Jaapia argillacea MUCL 33604 TaxID=933084 RepID=A0A067PSP8_9AGAM|nr:hypothetical protein JAAARDRAFT_39403 [Jaapia argillacea MUCL 33604]